MKTKHLDSFEISEGEWAILQAVWDYEPCNAVRIHELIQSYRPWHYSTVRTMMDRMVEKGLLTSEKPGKITTFRSAVSRAQAQRGDLLQTLKRAFRGALNPMMQCLLESHPLNGQELRELEQLIRNKRKTS